MYASFFGLHDEPFSVAPDPRFMYLSDAHREALKHLDIGLSGGGGFVLLTGEIGAGKTTVWRAFLEQLPPDVDIATVVNPRLRVDALLARVCEDLDVELPDGVARDPIDALHGHLLLSHAQGRRTLIAVDEAQALSDEVLEELRLLTNLVTSDRKLVQVLLIGQPELLDMLERPVLEPLAQRVVARYHLPALPPAETRRYIAHRLAVAGAGGPLPFDDPALDRVHQLCQGIPRRINVLCHRAMLAACEARRPRIDCALVDQAAAQVFTRPVRAEVAPRPEPPPAGAAPVPQAAPVARPALPQDADAAAPSRLRWRLAALAAAAGFVLSPWLRGLTADPVPPAPSASDTPVAAMAAVVPAAPPTLSPPDLLAAAVDETEAWRSLALAWETPLSRYEPCAQSAVMGLRCYRGKGGTGAIRALDRPVMLPLADAAGRRSHVVLTAIDGAQATLWHDGRTVQVPMVELVRVWAGDYGTLWRSPPGYRDGQKDPGADPRVGRWLVERLARVDGGKGGSLSERVAAFQAAQGLEPDGVAGAQTLMQLSRLTGADEPRLGYTYRSGQVP